MKKLLLISITWIVLATAFFSISAQGNSNRIVVDPEPSGSLLVFTPGKF